MSVFIECELRSENENHKKREVDDSSSLRIPAKRFLSHVACFKRNGLRLDIHKPQSEDKPSNRSKGRERCGCKGQRIFPPTSTGSRRHSMPRQFPIACLGRNIFVGFGLLNILQEIYLHPLR